jgi:DNA (cytosine-5)-methyltransferase 1
MSDPRPTVVSTFAGTGGSSLGYKLAGYKCRLAVEYDKHAIECYRANFPETTLYAGDICNLSVREALELSGLAPGELDIFDGSPPCQGFSTAKGTRNFYDDRNQLFREYVRLLKGFSPKAFVMENVTGMVRGKMKLIFREILRDLRSTGYKVEARVLNASHYGVPQRRQRVIFVGLHPEYAERVRKGLAYHPEPTVEKEVTLKEALADVEAKEFIAFEPGSLVHKVWTLMPPGKDATGLAHKCDPTKSERLGFSMIKLNPLRASNTVTKTLMMGKTAWGALIHWGEPRTMSIEELKIIGGFPPSWKLHGKIKDKWARIGNSVPPPMARAVAEHIGRELLGVL